MDTNPFCWQPVRGALYYAKSFIYLYNKLLHVSGNYKYNLLSQAYLSIVLGPLCRGPFVFYRRMSSSATFNVVRLIVHEDPLIIFYKGRIDNRALKNRRSPFSYIGHADYRQRAC